MRSQHPFLSSGTTFADYEVQSVIGQGGMGVVYQARDVRLDRKVALKLLAPEFTAHEGFRARFLRESRLAAAVDHPNIIPIYEAGDAGGQLFIAMRYVPGVDLRRELDRRRRLELPEALELLHQVAEALDAAHAAGLVHRDVKPGNILLAPPSAHGHRHAYLTDFGLTRRSASISGITTMGHFLGTLDYVAPEQIRGDPVDGRADVYSLACVAYTMLAGRPPFDQEDDLALMWAHLSRVAAGVGDLRPELAGDVEEALAAGLAKAPEDRPATCGALVDLMVGEHEASAGPAGPPDRSSPTSVPPSGPARPSLPEGSSPPGSRPSSPSGPRSHRWSWPPSHLSSGPRSHASSVPSGTPEEPPERSRRRPSRPWLAAAVTLVLAVAIAGGFVALRGGTERVVSFTAADVPFRLEVPEGWEVQGAGDSTVTVLSPTELTGLFEDDPAGMQAAADAVASDPEAVVGLALYHRLRLDVGSPAKQLPAAEAVLPGAGAVLHLDEDLTAGDLEAASMDGMLDLGDGASLQLRVLVVDSTPRQLLVFFAPPAVFSEQAATFDEVAGSLTAIG